MPKILLIPVPPDVLQIIVDSLIIVAGHVSLIALMELMLIVTQDHANQFALMATLELTLLKGVKQAVQQVPLQMPCSIFVLLNALEIQSSMEIQLAKPV